MDLADLGRELGEQVVTSCREREPSAAGVLVHGSYATGRARPESDLDLGIFLRDEPTVHYRTWFEERPGQPPLHISARSDLSIDAWEEESEESEDWSLGLPVEMTHVWLWVGDEKLVEVLGERPVMRKPGGSPEIEDMVDAILKMRRHAGVGDELGARLEAQLAARCATPAVAALNDTGPVFDPRSALDAVLELQVAPLTWRDDLPICLGLRDATLETVVMAGNRLVTSTLRLVREVNPHVDSQPETTRYIADGTFERLLA
jgi:phosphoribosyl-AMP cyclohydrolase